MATRRFHLYRGFPWTPLLLLFGATRGNSYVELGESTVRTRMGLLFDEKLPLAEVKAVTRKRWPWIMGVGWRTDLFGHVGLIGAYGEVVEIAFKRKLRVRLWPFPFRLPCDRLSVRVEDADGLVAALKAALA
jgi:hypothetical protein